MGSDREATAAPAVKAAGRAASVRSVRRALSVLRAFEDPPHSRGISDLSRALGLSKGTVHLLTVTLEKEGFLEKDATTRKYRLGAAVHGLTAAAQRDLRVTALEPMRRLYADTSFPVYLAIMLSGRAVIVEKAAPTLSFMSVLDVGSQVPLHSSALGKVLLAHATDPERDQLLAELERLGLPAATPATITSIQVLRDEINSIRARGLAFDHEESLPGVACVAAPVLDPSGRAVAAVAVAAPAASFPEDGQRKVVGGMVKRTADNISYRLGYRGATSKEV
ncbi:MAG: IclR family transcriptional regulator [Bacillota bacterium]|nr:MAG: IclR family transcriptional regulator [Bacillota bacterium]